MKYTAKINQTQLAGGVRIEPKGGEVSPEEAKKIAADPWGRELIEKKALQIEGFTLPPLEKPKHKK